MGPWFALLLMVGLLAGPCHGRSRIVPISEPVTFAKITQFLAKYPNVQKLGTLLHYLPKTYRAHYTLLHHSDSSQAASPESPRAIVFGATGDLVMAFNGNPKQAGYHKLELIEWQPKARAFEFREIEFPSPENHLKVATPSAANPRQCLTCHRSDPRPNWEPYALWPNAYAGDDDKLERDGETLNEKLKDFVATAASDPRYRHLPALKEGYFGKSLGRTPVEHNIRLSLLLNQRNYQRISRLMEATPDFASYRYGVMAYLAACPDPLTAYYPDGHLPESFGANPGYEGRSEHLLRFFEHLGARVSMWGTSFQDRPFDLTSPNSWGSELLAHILTRQRDVAPLFWEFDSYYHVPGAQALRDDNEKTCASLKKLSLAEWDDDAP